MRDVTLRFQMTDQALEDYRYWEKKNPKILKRIHALFDDIKQNPFRGLGKPEPVKLNLSGLWARRITKEHRCVYRLQDDRIIIRSLRFHYD